MSRTRCHAFIFLLASVLAPPAMLRAQAQARSAIVINDTLVYPESLTSASDGTVWFGSTSKGAVYKAAPGASRAELWIKGGTGGLQRVLGVLADEKARVLWVCSSPFNTPGGPPPGPTAIVSFDISSGALKASYPFTGGGGCNDMAVAADGTVYATDIAQSRVMRLRPNEKAFEPWAADARFDGADGLVVLADGAVYVNAVRSGELFRVPVRPDGSSGTIVKLTTSAPLGRPDGMRPVGPRTILIAEGGGRLLEATIQGDAVEVKVIKDGLSGTTAVTLVGDVAFVLESKFAFRNDPKLAGQDPGPFSAVAVPYTRPR